MAHVEKYVRTSVPHMVAHYERRKDEHGEYIKFANQNIDLSRTERNYNLGPPRPCGQAEFIQERCQELNAAKRKDLNVLADWIVTAPPSVIEAKMTDKFLAETYNFLAERYGEENVVSCYVHLDEVTPHLHFAFVPVTKDGRISARDRLCRYDLSTFHKDLDTHIKKKLGDSYKNDLLTGQTKLNGNKSVARLKEESKKVAQELEEIKPIRRGFGKVTLTEEAYDKCTQAVAQYARSSEVAETLSKDVNMFLRERSIDAKEQRRLEERCSTLEGQNKGLQRKVQSYEEFIEQPDELPKYRVFVARKSKRTIHSK